MLYHLFKKLYRKRLEKDLRDILGYYQFIGAFHTISRGFAGGGTAMSWKTFIDQLFR